MSQIDDVAGKRNDGEGEEYGKQKNDGCSSRRSFPSAYSFLGIRDFLLDFQWRQTPSVLIVSDAPRQRGAENLPKACQQQGLCRNVAFEVEPP
jgi:hypothetical protein